ncbi:hypothetical protein MMC16_000865 [Acarospora aff. strigata]|nr:hypothetical protein [Acarospora aff. strigata]
MSDPSESLTSLQIEQLTAAGQFLALQLRQVTDLTSMLSNNLILAACDPSKHKLTELEVITGFATLQAALDHLSRAYVTHTDTVLGRAPGTAIELKKLGDSIIENGLLVQRGATPAAGTEAGDGKKKRKRAPHDKNAPKRPLTPYFLYMHYARPEIAVDMPAGSAPKDIAEEGTKRWANMPKEARTMWDERYLKNLAKYYKRVEEYKAGRPIPDLENIPDEEANALIEKYIPASRRYVELPIDVADVAEEHSDEEVEEDEQGAEDEEPSPPPRAPSPPKSPKATKRRKTAKDAAEAKKSSPITVPGSSTRKAAMAVHSAEEDDDDDDQSKKTKTPEKKKRGPKPKVRNSIGTGKEEKSKKLAPEEPKSSPKGDSQESQKKEKKSRRKRQSEVTEA